jgi:hypothetical protein
MLGSQPADHNADGDGEAMPSRLLLTPEEAAEALRITRLRELP